MISRFEERYYNDINSLASTMPRVVELLEKLVDSKVPSTETQPTVKIASTTPIKKTKCACINCRDSKVPSTETQPTVKIASTTPKWKKTKQEIQNLRQKYEDNGELSSAEIKILQYNDGYLGGNRNHPRPINWNPDDEDELDLAVVFKNDKGKLVITPICTRCNYRYSAYSRNGTDWDCQNCGYEWQTNNNFSPLNFSYYRTSTQTRRPYDREQFHQG